jgi:dihydrofolate reductase
MIGIVAMSDFGVIGYQGRLPWKIPGDLKWFKETTMGHVVLFGRSTAESVGPLKGRDIWTLTRNPTKEKEISDPLDIVPTVGQKVFLAGGAQIYKKYLHLCEELYVSHIDGNFEGDAHFPFLWEREYKKPTTVFVGDGFAVKHYVRKIT